MASTTQEKIMPLDGMTFAEFADPSYFIFASRAAQKKQKRTITPGMTWKLYNDTMPEEEITSPIERDAIQQDASTTIAPAIRDEHEEMVHFLDPWEGMMELHPQDMKKGNKSRNWSPLDPAGAFFGL